MKSLLNFLQLRPGTQITIFLSNLEKSIYLKFAPAFSKYFSLMLNSVFCSLSCVGMRSKHKLDLFLRVITVVAYPSCLLEKTLVCTLETF